MKKFFIFLLIVAIEVSGCSTTGLQAKDFPYEMMLQLTDLPSEYNHLESNFPDVKNGKSFEVAFKNNNDFIGSTISHQIAIFQDSTSAQEYYELLKSNYLKGYYLPTNLEFSPENSEDTFQLGCIDASISNVDTQSCKLIQLHNNLVIEVSTNINGMNLNMDEFNNILKVLDSRLPIENTPTPTW